MSEHPPAVTGAGGAPVQPLRTDPAPGSGTSVASRIAGLSALKGLLLYGAIAGFVVLFADIVAQIWSANGTKPTIDPIEMGAAAALAGVLGAAFAVYIGVPSSPDTTNEALRADLKSNPGSWATRLRRVLSLESGGENSASWPLTAGIWVYAIVATAVAVTYVANPAETPDEVRSLALAFGGYVIAMIYAAYGISPKK